jgi:hypothetical protein
MNDNDESDSIEDSSSISAPDDGIKDNGAFDDEIIDVGEYDKEVKDDGTPVDRDNKGGNNNDGNTGVNKLITYEVKKRNLMVQRRKK